MKRLWHPILIALLLSISLPNLLAAQYAEHSAIDSLQKLIANNPKHLPTNSLWHYALAELYYEKQDSTLSTQYTQQAIKLAKQKDDWQLLGKSYTLQATLYLDKLLLESAITYYDSALYAFQLASDTIGMVLVYANQALPLARVGDCPKAISSFQKAEILIERESNWDQWFAIMINHAYGLIICEHYESVLPLGEKALVLARRLEKPRYEIRLLDVLATACTELAQFEKAILYFEEANQLLGQLDDLEMESVIYSNAGLALMELGRYPEAYENFLHAMHIDTLLGNTLSENYTNLGLATQYMENYEESIDFFVQGIEHIKQEQKYVYLPDVYQWAAVSYHGLGMDDTAYELLLSAASVRDSLHYENKQAQLRELSTRYETEKMKQELLQSTLEIESQKYQKRIFLLISIGLIALFLLIITVGWVLYRQRKLLAGKRQIELRYNLLRAQMNPHFLFNALHAIQGFFARKDFQKGNDYLGTFSQLIRRILDQTAHQTIYLSDEISTLELYLQLEQSRLRDVLQYKIDIAPNVDTDWVRVPPLILQPFVENAIWHGIAPKDTTGTVSIMISLSTDESFLLCDIKDDGVGIRSKATESTSSSYLSKGIQITRERLGAEGQVIITSPVVSKPDHFPGVLVKLVIPIDNGN